MNIRIVCYTMECKQCTSCDYVMTLETVRLSSSVVRVNKWIEQCETYTPCALGRFRDRVRLGVRLLLLAMMHTDVNKFIKMDQFLKV